MYNRLVNCTCDIKLANLFGSIYLSAHGYNGFLMLQGCSKEEIRHLISALSLHVAVCRMLGRPEHGDYYLYKRPYAIL
jgi:hypothetical protein